MPFCNSPIKKFSSFTRWIDTSFYFLCLLSPTLQPIFIFQNQRFHVTQCLFVIFPLPPPLPKHRPYFPSTSPIFVCKFADRCFPLRPSATTCLSTAFKQSPANHQLSRHFFNASSWFLRKDFIQSNAALKQSVCGFFLIFQNNRYPTVFEQPPANHQSSRHFFNASSCFLRKDFSQLNASLKQTVWVSFWFFKIADLKTVKLLHPLLSCLSAFCCFSPHQSAMNTLRW